ncbi:MAG: hypothetical protein ABEI31_09055, partial [Halodesulfurarchaeum sp.]
MDDRGPFRMMVTPSKPDHPPPPAPPEPLERSQDILYPVGEQLRWTVTGRADTMATHRTQYLKEKLEEMEARGETW